MKVFLSFILIFVTMPLLAQNSVLRQGNKAYDEGKFGTAFELYEKASVKTPIKAAYNSGTALYKLKDYGAAASSFEKALKEPRNKEDAKLNQNTLYNLGNAAYKAGNKEEGKKAMRAAILQNLNDKDAQQNLQFMLIEGQSQNQCDNPNNNPQQNKDNKENKQNQDKQNQDKQKQEQKEQEKQQQEKQEKENSAKEEAASILQMAQEHKQDLPKSEQRSNQVEKDW